LAGFYEDDGWDYKASLPSSIFSICQQFLALSAIFSCFSLDRTAKTRQLLKMAIFSIFSHFQPFSTVSLF
jgi:hypothetical protein